MALSPREVQNLTTSLSTFKTLFPPHFDILMGENVFVFFVFSAPSKHSVQHTLDIQLTDIGISERIHGTDEILGHPMSGVTDMLCYNYSSEQKPHVRFAIFF